MAPTKARIARVLTALSLASCLAACGAQAPGGAGGARAGSVTFSGAEGGQISVSVGEGDGWAVSKPSGEDTLEFEVTHDGELVGRGFIYEASFFRDWVDSTIRDSDTLSVTTETDTEVVIEDSSNGQVMHTKIVGGGSTAVMLMTEPGVDEKLAAEAIERLSAEA